MPADDEAQQVLSVSVAEFQDQCLKLVSEVANSGSEVIITRDGQPVSRLVPVRKPKIAPFGRDKDIIQIHGDIIEPIGTNWEKSR